MNLWSQLERSLNLQSVNIGCTQISEKSQGRGCYQTGVLGIEMNLELERSWQSEKIDCPQTEKYCRLQIGTSHHYLFLKPCPLHWEPPIIS